MFQSWSHTHGTDIYNDIINYLHLLMKQFKQHLLSMYTWHPLMILLIRYQLLKCMYPFRSSIIKYFKTHSQSSIFFFLIFGDKEEKNLDRHCLVAIYTTLQKTKRYLGRKRAGTAGMRTKIYLLSMYWNNLRYDKKWANVVKMMTSKSK